MSRRAARKISRSKPQATSVARSTGWQDKLGAWAWLVLPVLAVVMIVVFIQKAQWSRSIDYRLEAWKTAYGMDTATVSKFREMEIEFHGSGNPFTSPIAHNVEEIRIHHAKMGALLTGDHRRAFLHDMEIGRWAY